MSKGYDRHRQRLAELQALGRPLARRAKSRCELCEGAGRPLQPWEVPPLGDQVALERTLLLCADCLRGAEGKTGSDDSRWRFLGSAAWSESVAVQVVAVRLVRHFSDRQPWARDLLDSLYLTEEVEAWVAAD